MVLCKYLQIGVCLLDNDLPVNNKGGCSREFFPNDLNGSQKLFQSERSNYFRDLFDLVLKHFHIFCTVYNLGTVYVGILNVNGFSWRH